MLCYVAQNCSMLCYFGLCCATLSYVVLYCAMLQYVVLSCSLLCCCAMLSESTQKKIGKNRNWALWNCYFWNLTVYWKPPNALVDDQPQYWGCKSEIKGITQTTNIRIDNTLTNKDGFWASARAAPLIQGSKKYKKCHVNEITMCCPINYPYLSHRKFFCLKFPSLWKLPSSFL